MGRQVHMAVLPRGRSGGDASREELPVDAILGHEPGGGAGGGQDAELGSTGQGWSAVAAAAALAPAGRQSMGGGQASEDTSTLQGRYSAYCAHLGIVPPSAVLYALAMARPLSLVDPSHGASRQMVTLPVAQMSDAVAFSLADFLSLEEEGALLVDANSEGAAAMGSGAGVLHLLRATGGQLRAVDLSGMALGRDAFRDLFHNGLLSHTLNLARCRLKKLDLVGQFPHLQSLVLDDNPGITSLPEGCFSGAPRLSSISLCATGISNPWAATAALAGLPCLRELRFQRCKCCPMSTAHCTAFASELDLVSAAAATYASSGRDALLDGRLVEVLPSAVLEMLSEADQALVGGHRRRTAAAEAGSEGAGALSSAGYEEEGLERNPSEDDLDLPLTLRNDFVAETTHNPQQVDDDDDMLGHYEHEVEEVEDIIEVVEEVVDDFEEGFGRPHPSGAANLGFTEAEIAATVLERSASDCIGLRAPAPLGSMPQPAVEVDRRWRVTESPGVWGVPVGVGSIEVTGARRSGSQGTALSAEEGAGEIDAMLEGEGSIRRRIVFEGDGGSIGSPGAISGSPLRVDDNSYQTGGDVARRSLELRSVGDLSSSDRLDFSFSPLFAAANSGLVPGGAHATPQANTSATAAHARDQVLLGSRSSTMNSEGGWSSGGSSIQSGSTFSAFSSRSCSRNAGESSAYKHQVASSAIVASAEVEAHGAPNEAGSPPVMGDSVGDSGPVQGSEGVRAREPPSFQGLQPVQLSARSGRASLPQGPASPESGAAGDEVAGSGATFLSSLVGNLPMSPAPQDVLSVEQAPQAAGPLAEPGGGYATLGFPRDRTLSTTALAAAVAARAVGDAGAPNSQAAARIAATRASALLSAGASAAGMAEAQAWWAKKEAASEPQRVAALWRQSTLEQSSPICLQQHYREFLVVRLPRLAVLDNLAITDEEKDNAWHAFSQHFEPVAHGLPRAENITSLLQRRETQVSAPVPARTRRNARAQKQTENVMAPVASRGGVGGRVLPPWPCTLGMQHAAETAGDVCGDSSREGLDRLKVDSPASEATAAGSGAGQEKSMAGFPSPNTLVAPACASASSVAGSVCPPHGQALRRLGPGMVLSSEPRRGGGSMVGFRRALGASRVQACNWLSTRPMMCSPEGRVQVGSAAAAAPGSPHGDHHRRYRPRQFEYHPTDPHLMVFGTLHGEVVVVNHEAEKIVGQVHSIGAPHSILGLCWLNKDPSKLIGGCDNGSIQLYDINHMRACYLASLRRNQGGADSASAAAAAAATAPPGMAAGLPGNAVAQTQPGLLRVAAGAGLGNTLGGRALGGGGSAPAAAAAATAALGLQGLPWARGPLGAQRTAGGGGAVAGAPSPSTSVWGWGSVRSPAIYTYEDFEQLTSVHVNCTDDVFVASGYSNHVGLYDLRTGKRLHVFPNLHQEHINVLKFSHHSPHLFATSSFDRDIKLWDARQRIHADGQNPIYSVRSKRGNVMVCFSPDDHYLLASAIDNEVRQYSASDGRLQMTCDIAPVGSQHNYTRSYYMNGRDYIVSGSCEENIVRICCAQTGRRLRDVVLEGKGGRSSLYVQSLRGDPFRDFHLSVLVAYSHPNNRSEIVKVNLVGNNAPRSGPFSELQDVPLSGIGA